MEELHVSVCFHHGGQLVKRAGILIYKGGTLEAETRFDKDKISRIEILWAIWVLGYNRCGPIYYKDMESGVFFELCNDIDVTNYLSGVSNNHQAIIYVDSPCDEITNWVRKSEEERAVHSDRATITDIDAFLIKRSPKEEAELGEKADFTCAAKEVLEIAPVGGSIADIDKERAICRSVETDDSDSEDKSNGEESSDEAYDAKIDDENTSDVDGHAEFVTVREGRTKLRLESLRRKKAAVEESSVRLGPVGVDQGLEKYIREGNPYAGLLGGDEDYVGSSDVDSFESEDDSDLEVNENRRRKLQVHYDPTCEQPLWELGMIFKNVKQFREAITYYAVKKGVEVYFVQNEPNRVRAQCSYDGCPWVLLGSLEKKSGNFRVKTYYPVHRCERRTRNRHCNAEFIAKFLRQNIVENPNIKIWMMQDILQKRLEVYAGKTVCKRARKKVLQSLIGDYTEEFSRLLDYRDCLLESNPGSNCVVDVEVEGEPSKYIFRGMYVCFAAMKSGFEHGCRRFIGFDGCFLKGAFKGQILSATAKNGNNEIYPLAWGVVHNETNATWKWFIEKVRDDLSLGRGEGLAVVTDMQKGLENAISDILPEAEHRECARHILANWAKKWRGVERRQAFWRCAKSTFEAQLKDNLEELSTLGGDQIVHDLLHYNVERWCRVYLKPHTVCDFVDNNVSETFNSWILAPRNKSIITMLEEIRTMMMQRHTKMVRFANTWITDISPMAYKVLDTNVSRAMNCIIVWNGEAGYEVVEGKYRHVVHLINKTCTCRAWALKGIPCAHAVAVMHTKNLNPIDFVSKWYHKETYLQAYKHFIQPMPNLKVYNKSSNPKVEPPPVKPLPGRPKRNRRKPRDEIKKFGKLSKAGCHVTCSYCKGQDHNKKGCLIRKTAEENGAHMETISSNKRASSSSGKKGSVSAKSKASAQLGICGPNKMSGLGVYINERTGWTCHQNGRAKDNIVISTGSVQIKNSAEVTGDLGFKPAKRKWKGNEVVTQGDLLKKRAIRQYVMTDAATQQNQRSQPTVEQKMRAAANKAAAESILAEKRASKSSSQPGNTVTRSNVASKSFSTQPSQEKFWKY